MVSIRTNPHLDGRKVGLIVPSVNTTTEPEFAWIAPPGISFHAARIFMNVTSPDALRAMNAEVRHAARQLATLSPELLAYVCTAGSFVDGVEGRKVDKTSRTRPFVAAFLFLCGTSVALVPLVHGYSALIVLVAGILACSIAGCANVAAFYSDLLIDGRRMGAVSGMIITFVNVFGIAAPVLTGYIVGWTGSFDKAFYFAAALLVVAALSLSAVKHEPFDQVQRI